MPANHRAERRIAYHIENLNSLDHVIRCRAVGYLLRWYVPRAADQLLQIIDHPNPYVRLYAAWVLGHTHDPRAFEPILRLCSDPDESVRYDATIALGILDDPRVIEPLKSILLANDYTRPAADAFRRMGPKVVPVLSEMLPEASAEVRWSITQVIGNFAVDYDDLGSMELLKLCLSDEDAQVRENAKDWVDEIGGLVL